MIPEQSGLKKITLIEKDKISDITYPDITNDKLITEIRVTGEVFTLEEVNRCDYKADIESGDNNRFLFDYKLFYSLFNYTQQELAELESLQKRSWAAVLFFRSGVVRFINEHFRILDTIPFKSGDTHIFNIEMGLDELSNIAIQDFEGDLIISNALTVDNDSITADNDTITVDQITI